MQLKNLIIFFIFLFLLACGSSSDNANKVVGLHVLSEFGNKYEFVSSNPTGTDISSALKKLDWKNNFYQVILVTSPGVSIEVGGSLNPKDGLSSVYRDIDKKDYRVTKEPPSTIKEMEAILLSFHKGNNEWEKMYVYEKLAY